ncbi:MAG: hypothetical protein ACRDP7_45735 [Trebonia sp.]
MAYGVAELPPFPGHFVPDSIVERFCLLAPASSHIERLAELESIGCDQFTVYLMHDEDATSTRTARRSSRR